MMDAFVGKEPERGEMPFREVKLYRTDRRGRPVEVSVKAIANGCIGKMLALALFVAAAGLCPAAQPVSTGKCLHVYILTGQSNSLGAVKGDPASAETLAYYSTVRGADEDGIRMWDGNMAGSLTDPATGGSAWGREGKRWMTVQPQAAPAGKGRRGASGTPYEFLTGQADLRRAWEGGFGAGVMGPEYGFAYMMQKKGWQVNDTDDVAIIKASRDGGSNENWMKPPDDRSSNAYTFLIRSVVQALGALDLTAYRSVQAEGLLYLQGESGRPEHAAQARSVIEGWVANIRTDVSAALVADPVRAGCYAVHPDCIVVGEPAAWGKNDPASCSALTGQKLLAWADSCNHVGFVHTRDLGKIAAGDNMQVHYDGNSELTIGARYAYALAAVQGWDTTEGGSVRVRSQQFGDTDMVPTAAPIYLNDAAAWWQSRGDAVAFSAASMAEAIAVWDLSSAAMGGSMQGCEMISDTWSVKGIRIEDPYADDDTVGTHNATVNIECARGRHAALSVGTAGIELQRGNLNLRTDLHLRGKQIWRVAGGKRLVVRGGISGDGAVTLHKHPGVASADVAEFDLRCMTDAGQRTWRVGSGVSLLLPEAGLADSTVQIVPSASVSLSGERAAVKSLEIGEGATLRVASGLNLSADAITFKGSADLVFDGSSGRFGALHAASLSPSPDTAIKVRITRLPASLLSEYILGTGWSGPLPLLGADLPAGFRLSLTPDGTLRLHCPPTDVRRCGGVRRE